MRIAGNEMDDAIVQHLKRKYNLLIGERTAAQIKIELGSAYPLPESRAVSSCSVDALAASADAPISLPTPPLLMALARPPPELSADIMDRGIVLSGGGALIRGLDQRLRSDTGLPVVLADDPLAAVFLGTGRMLEDMDLLRKGTLL